MGNSDSKEGEIIIKCTLDEMVKHFFKDYVIVWHDPNVDNKENQQHITRLAKFCEVFTFTEWEKAKDYIQSTQVVCHVITSGTNGELLVKEISQSDNVSNIYIFCKNKEHHSKWAQNFHKISSIETNIQNLINQIQQNLLEWYKKASSLNFNLPAFAPIFNDSDKSEMNHLHRYLRIIPNFQSREQAKADFLNLSKALYSDEKNQNFLTSFEKYYNEYNKSQTLRWYTQESFLYKVTNNCLRIASSDSIQYCRLPLKDIEQAIKDQYQAKSKIFSGLLYRGAYLSQEEWSSLKENQDKEIEMHGFLSVSKEKNVALHFMQTDPSKKVFITILVPKGPNEEEQGFAEIEEYSRFPQEKEILFNVRSRFTVLETEDDYEYSEATKCRHLVLLYGAQGFRRFMTEQSPTQEVSITNIENIAESQRSLFISIKTGLYYGQKYLDSDAGPFFCVTMDKAKELNIAKIHGCLLLNSSQDQTLQTPFYGYKCSQCQVKEQKSYFICTDCNGKKFCQNCFEGETFPCLQGKHHLILETSPYTFWCEKMSPAELNHMKFQNDLVDKRGDLFQQANMYLESHKYEKAIEYYSLYIQQNEAKGRSDKLAASYSNIGEVYCSQGEYQKAQEYLLKCLDILEDLHGENDLSVAASTHNLGNIYQHQGEYKKALEYYLKSLTIQKSVYGDRDPAVATAIGNIGQVYEDQGEYNKALEYYLKSLEIFKSIHKGNNHPDIAASYKSIGSVYEHQGEYKKALEYYLQSLDILKSLYGENDPSVASSYGNIGKAFYNQREYDQALEYHLKSLQILKYVYGGDNHPNMSTSYNDIGQVYHGMGEYEEALKYYLKSLNIAKSVHGEHHSHVATTYDNIGLIYDHQGEHEKALEYNFKSLDIFKSVHGGDNHPDVATAYNNIGGVFHRQGESEKALEYFLKCLDIRKSIYGTDNHPNIAQSYSNVGSVYEKQGEDKKALEYYLKALEVERSVYGEDHQEVASSLDNIGDIYNQLGESKKALEYYLKCLNIRISLNGDDHPEVAMVYNKIGLIYRTQGENNKALEYSLKSLDIVKSVFGDDHPDVASSYGNIASLYDSQGEYKMALEYYLKSLEIFESIYGENHPYTIQMHNAILEITSMNQNE